MMPLKIRRYPLALAAFLLLSIVPTVAEVVKSMSDCGQFLLEKTVLQIPGILKDGDIQNKVRYKPICQTFENVPRFLTLYDTENRIPVFSAYKYTKDPKDTEGKRPDIPWMIEPQLEQEDGDKNMMKKKTKQPKYQASDDDYKKNAKDKGFNRGHLFPSSHALTEAGQKSTFTLTNIVPQAITFNGGSWNNMEQCIKCVMDKDCINNNGKIEGFVVTGAQPSTKNILNNRVNIPSMLWSAFCCYSSKEKKWIASAHWGDNVADDPKDKYLQTKSLKELNDKLSGTFNVFPTDCPLDTTVTSITKSYPKNCNCPQ